MIYLESRHEEIVHQILSKYPYQFYVFGSRAKGNTRSRSDLDLCFKDQIPLSVQSHIEEDFEESDFPFLVDLVDWNMIDEGFKKHIEKDLVPI